MNEATQEVENFRITHDEKLSSTYVINCTWSICPSNKVLAYSANSSCTTEPFLVTSIWLWQDQISMLTSATNMLSSWKSYVKEISIGNVKISTRCDVGNFANYSATSLSIVFKKIMKNRVFFWQNKIPGRK